MLRHSVSLFLVFVSLSLLARQSRTTRLPVSAVRDKLQQANSARMTGYIGEKLNASYQNRIMAQDISRLVGPFQKRTETSCWQSEFWGKWFTSAILAYRYKPEPQLKEKLDKAVEGLIATQTPDGYIGNYVEDKHLENWDIWGRKYCMLGLLAYYDMTKEKKALQAACKVADHLMKELAECHVLIIGGFKVFTGCFGKTCKLNTRIAKCYAQITSDLGMFQFII